MKAIRAMKNQKGFTLIEIMIVVLIIGILLAIAIPNFMKARETSRTKACVSNLKQIDSAKQQWAMEKKASDGDACTDGDIIGDGLYIKNAPVCPSGGDYTVNDIGADPTCSYRWRARTDCCSSCSPVRMLLSITN